MLRIRKHFSFLAKTVHVWERVLKSEEEEENPVTNLANSLPVRNSIRVLDGNISSVFFGWGAGNNCTTGGYWPPLCLNTLELPRTMQRICMVLLLENTVFPPGSGDILGSEYFKKYFKILTSNTVSTILVANFFWTNSCQLTVLNIVFLSLPSQQLNQSASTSNSHLQVK